MLPCKHKSLARRSFLRGVGSASTAAIAGAAISIASTEEAEAYDAGKRETRARYRPDSPDVQAFYRTNGYESLKK
jgi:hypothetical protein